MLQLNSINVGNLNSRLYRRGRRLFWRKTYFTHWHCHTYRDQDAHAQVHLSTGLACIQTSGHNYFLWRRTRYTVIKFSLPLQGYSQVSFGYMYLSGTGTVIFPFFISSCLCESLGFKYSSFISIPVVFPLNHLMAADWPLFVFFIRMSWETARRWGWIFMTC